MNSNYSYFILSKTWDLDYDVLQLVKKWLEPHLKRRILNEDYNKFMKYASDEFNIHSHPLALRYENAVMMSRFGFKNNIDHEFNIRENETYKIKPYTIYELHDEYKSHYYICEQPIMLTNRQVIRYDDHNGHGVTDYNRKIFFLNCRDKSNCININGEMFNLIRETGNLKSFIRILMDKEETAIMNINY